MFYVMCPIYVYIIFFDAENNTDYNVKKTIFIVNSIRPIPPFLKEICDDMITSIFLINRYIPLKQKIV